MEQFIAGARQGGVRAPSDAGDFLAALRAARRSAARLPDFFLVGHAKCGTTAMYEMLRSHPQVYMATPKETQFLARGPSERPSSRDRRGARVATLADYLAVFQDAPAQRRAGEASTTYLRTPQVAGRIAALCPDARIIAILREPASFLRSLHLQLLEVGLERERDFAAALALESQRRRGLALPADSFWANALLYSEHVRYAEQLRRYHQHFGHERVLVLLYEDFRRDNEQVMRQIYRFLDVDDAAAIEQREANRTVRMRSHRAQAQLNALALGRGRRARALKAGVQAVIPAPFRRRALHAASRMLVDGRPREPTEDFMQQLRRRFEPEVREASDYLQRDLVKLWDYD